VHVVSKDSSFLQHTLATRVRKLRKAHGFTRAALAERSGLSVRFLARIEASEGNVSLVRLGHLAEALGTTPGELIRADEERTRVLALVGMRGAGKSTVGPILARGLGVPFVEMDVSIVDASGLPLDQIFELHGERYYRRVEREIVTRVLGRGDALVLAASGGIVNEPTTWELLRAKATVVWLKAEPEDHWNRVVAQGDRRPMADNPDAMAELRAIHAARERLYAQAHLTVETSGVAPEDVAVAVERSLESREGVR
jgi:XRE family transcriptional regulator, aerobic/anaerobic benzoate catabolism transcriptional regulator